MADRQRPLPVGAINDGVYYCMAMDGGREEKGEMTQTGKKSGGREERGLVPPALMSFTASPGWSGRIGTDCKKKGSFGCRPEVESCLFCVPAGCYLSRLACRNRWGGGFGPSLGHSGQSCPGVPSRRRAGVWKTCDGIYPARRPGLTAVDSGGEGGGRGGGGIKFRFTA